MNRANTILRDSLNGSFSAIVVDDKEMYDEVREYIKVIAPEQEKIVKLYKGKIPVFDHYDISRQIKSLFPNTFRSSVGRISSSSIRRR